jgi:hypothetical protein
MERSSEGARFIARQGDQMAIKGKAWERIEFTPADDKRDGQPVEMFRLAVPEGWLVAAGWGTHPSAPTFVPDAEHAWDPSK